MQRTSAIQKISSRFFIIGMAIALIFAFQAHGSASAVTCPTLSPGNLFKVEGVPSIYLLNGQNERMYFPNSDTFHTYYEGFSSVNITEISQSCVDQYPVATRPSGVPFRAGSRLVKVAVSSKIYGVGFGGKRFLIPDAVTAASLYGTDWPTLVRDVHDFHWANYSPGPKIVNQEPHDGMLISVGKTGKSLYIQDIYAYEVSPDLPDWAHADARFISNKAYSNLVEIDRDIKTFSPDEVLSPPTYARQSDTIGHNEPAFGFSLDLPTTMDGYWTEIEQLDPDTEGQGTYIRFYVDAPGTTYEESGISYPPFLVTAYDRDWWYANADQTNPPMHTYTELEDPEQNPWPQLGSYLGEDMHTVFTYSPNRQDCPGVRRSDGELDNSHLCKLSENVVETMNTFSQFESRG